MARAKTRTWFNLVAGLVVGTTAQPLLVEAAPDGTGPAESQATPDHDGSAKSGVAIAPAADAMRRGDYDAAASLLRRAAADPAASDPAAARDLARLREELSVAVQARHAGAEQIKLAEDAVRQGNEARAADLLRRVTANAPYLSVADQQRVTQLTATIRAQAPSAADRPAPPTTGVAAPGGALATAQARAKLQMARTQMAQFNFDRAEQLVHEAERLQPKLAPTEDSPKKVLDELARVRTDPKALLTAARVALGRKDYGHAEEFARLSEKNAGAFTFPFWGDNPAKVLKDVQELRSRTPAAVAAAPKAPASQAPAKPAPAKDPAIVQTAATAPAKPAADPSKPAAGTPEATGQAVTLIKQARQALASNDVTKAKKLNDQARLLKPNLHWWEDNPEKVQADIAKAEVKAKPAVVQASAKTPAAATPAPVDLKKQPLNKEEAVALVKQGRILLAENKFDEATQASLKARSNANLSWGLFEDTPEKLRQDIDKVRARHDREESVKVLADARRLYEEGKYDDALKAAYRAQKMHGAYNVWDLGDRPQRVEADVLAAKTRIAKGLPVDAAKKDTAVAKKDAPKAPPAQAVAQAAKPTPATDPKVAQARQAMAEARVALRLGDTARAQSLAEQVKGMHVGLNVTDDSPDAILRDVQRMAPAAPITTVQAVAPAPVAAAAAAPAADTKAVATRLLVEAKALQKEQKLLEARDKVVAAEQLHAAFAPGEETPEMVLQNLGAEARWEVEWMMREAVRVTGTSGPDMAKRFQSAERALTQARAIATGFGMDVRAIESKLEWVRGQQAVARGEAAPATPVVSAAPKNQGQVLLEKARLEIQRGDTTAARKLAEEAAQGPYGVQAEAFAVLRSIGAEEVNQRRLESNRTFDAALAAYNRRDFPNAANLVQLIDPNSLDESRRSKLREIAMTPEMQPQRRSPITQVQAVNDPGLPPVPSLTPKPILGEQPGIARAEDQSPGDTLVAQTAALRQVKFQKLRQDGLDVMRDASEKFRTGQTDAAIDMLQDYIAQLGDAQLELGQVAMLRRQPEARLQQFKLMKAQRDFLSEQDGVVKRSHDEKSREVLVEQNKQKKVAELMKQYNTRFQEGKYPEAERLAMQAHDLNPDDPMAAAAMSIARQQYRIKLDKRMNKDNDDLTTAVLRGTGELGPGQIGDTPLVVDADASAEAKKRGLKYGSSFVATAKSEKVREIERRLLAPVTLNFTDTPLKNVIDDLRAWQGINIFVDQPALEADGISIEKPVTIKLEQIPMKSALNLLLKGSHLTWTVRDDVLQITTPRNAKGALQTNTIQVADLVIPVQDFGAFKPASTGPSPLGIDVSKPANGPTAMPYTGPRSLTNGEPTGSSYGGSPFGTEGGQSQSQVTKSGPVGTTEEKLMNLIKSTIAPESWSDSGGPGTIDYFPLSMSLVINQTPDIQEQVADLLAALRRLQDQEVAVEVRFITINDSFFERIGVNFALNVLTKQTGVQPQLTSGVFTPDGFINAFMPKNTIVGLQPTGTFTPDLNIPITNQTYTQTFPDFGGYQGIPGFGGLTLGLAFLSDIQVFLFLEAVQGDVRTNLMQAPKLTMFNGQTASINVTDFQTFITSVSVTPTQGVFTYTPTITVFPVGVTLVMSSVISADRRFVRMSLAPTLSNLAQSGINLFPVVVPIFPDFGNTGVGQPVVFTQYIQQPVFNSVTVNTTVAVPDGGTVLMGGLKLLSEERKEFGPPILSKIPYLNRLFKNTSYGRDAQSLLIMVTPRIIIQEEEEEKQTGYVRPVQPSF